MTDSPRPSISELFERDPLELSAQDLDQIIAKLRSDRAQYTAGKKAAGNKKNSDKPALDLDLNELGL